MRVARNSAAAAPPGLAESFDSGYFCLKHGAAAHPRHGVCAGCLRDQLLRLCPECAHLRPCCCSSSSSSSSDLSRSGVGDAFVAAGKAIGAVAPVSKLIESEPAFRRSRSLVIPIFRQRASVDGDSTSPVRTRGWGFWRKGEAKMERSRSVANDGVGEGKGWRWGWGFPSPMKALRHRRAAALYRR